MKLIIIGLAVAVPLGAASVLAQEAERQPPATQAHEQAPSQEEEAEAPAEPDSLDEVICRRERATGSLTRRTETCRTRREWNEATARTRDAMDATVRGAAGGKICSGNPMGGC